MDAILGAVETLRTRTSNARVGVAIAVGAGTVGALGAGGGGGATGGSGGGNSGGMLKFRALEERTLLAQVGGALGFLFGCVWGFWSGFFVLLYRKGRRLLSSFGSFVYISRGRTLLAQLRGRFLFSFLIYLFFCTAALLALVVAWRVFVPRERRHAGGG